MKKSLACAFLTLASASVIAANVATPGTAPDQQPVTTADEQTATTTLDQQLSQLSYTAQNINESEQVRAKALRQLANYPSQNALVAVARGLKDPSYVVREAAIIGAEPYQLEHRWRIVAPLLTDQNEVVRVTAAASLVRDYANVTPDQQQQLETPIAELKDYLANKEDFDSQLLLADVLRWNQEWALADKHYQTLLIEHDDNPQVWLNIADNYRAQNQDKRAIETLDTAIRTIKDVASLHYAKSLTLVRMDEKKIAANEIEIAAKLAKDNSYYWYLNGVLQEEYDIDKSTKSFEKAYLISGAPEQLYAVCDIYVRYGNEHANSCLDELGKIAPPYVVEDLRAKQKNASDS
ncbi:tetratricopeptide repeat protein [Vibrio methylphosphonaticus]|uniref:hypothetical protein n=1 Tax=Vibrio methylphosphonaticus TaxID=2946866 RepID=UPI00202ABA22|nr:hypothetical protein [Vibrio methylphosphonaticus]MCL9776238.1 hypothetical protein [Vibrio methylphosphonaticus]